MTLFYFLNVFEKVMTKDSEGPGQVHRCYNVLRDSLVSTPVSKLLICLMTPFLSVKQGTLYTAESPQNPVE